MSDSKPKETIAPKQSKEELAKANVKVILIYSLAISASLAFNALMQTALSRLTSSNKLFGELLYFLILIALVIGVTYFANAKFGSPF